MTQTYFTLPSLRTGGEVRVAPRDAPSVGLRSEGWVALEAVVVFQWLIWRCCSACLFRTTRRAWQIVWILVELMYGREWSRIQKKLLRFFVCIHLFVISTPFPSLTFFMCVAGVDLFVLNLQASSVLFRPLPCVGMHCVGGAPLNMRKKKPDVFPFFSCIRQCSSLLLHLPL